MKLKRIRPLITVSISQPAMDALKKEQAAKMVTASNLIDQILIRRYKIVAE